MVILKNDEEMVEYDTFMESFLKNEETECALYSKEGVRFNVHKEIFFQSKLMQNLLLDGHSGCCNKIEIICPCTENELESILSFLYDGKFSSKERVDTFNVIGNLTKVFGFPQNRFSIEECLLTLVTK